MINYKDRLNDITQNYLDISKKYLTNEEYNNKSVSIYENIIERINSVEPSIMVYGIYNAGKSTLINALKGENICVVGDRPETFKVTPYEWGGYTIIDAPGVNVPIKDHEVVSESHLKKSDIVLFVISTNGTFDEERNYIEMTKIIKSSKKLLIILNNKDRYEKNDEEIINIKSKILENLSKYSRNEKIGNEYEVLLVDAKTALEAKTDYADDEETKNILINESNILEVEKKFMQTFKETKVFDILKTPIYNLNEEISILLNLIKDKLDSDSDREVFSIKERYYDLIENFAIVVEGEISQFVTNYTDLISSKIYNNESIEDISNNIYSLYKSTLIRNMDKIKSEVINNKEIRDAINNNIDKLKTYIENPQINISNIELNIRDEFEEDNYYNYTDEIAISQEDSHDLVGNVGVAILQKEALDKIATTGMKEVTKLATTKASKKALTKVIGIANPVIGILTTALSIGSILSSMNKAKEEKEFLEAQERAAIENRRAQEEANMKALKLQHANSSAKAIMFDTENALKDNLNTIFIQLKDLVEYEINSFINLNKQKENEVSRDLDELDKLKNELMIIKNNI